jgi:DNA-binding transcriptional LysR family regulator
MGHGVADFVTLIEDVRDLQALCLTVDLRSLTAAAARMRESKATVSRRIARLERCLGVALVYRSPKRVEPTEQGDVYRLRAREILELLGEANATAAGARSAPSGRLRVTMPGELGSLLAPHLIAFAEAHPAVLVETITTQTILDLDGGNIDVALRVSPKLPDSSLVAHRLCGLETALVASRSYLAERRAPKRAQDLAAHRLIFLELAGRMRAASLRAKDGSDYSLSGVRPFVTATELSFVKELALAGAGIAGLPVAAIAPELEAGALKRVLEDYSMELVFSLYLVHVGTRILTPKVRAFRDFFLAAFGARGRRLRAK